MAENTPKPTFLSSVFKSFRLFPKRHPPNPLEKEKEIPKKDTPKPTFLGPLLRYVSMTEEGGECLWRGSLLVVHLASPQGPPDYQLKIGGKTQKAYLVFDDKERSFWRFDIEVALTDKEKEVEYEVLLKEPQKNFQASFWVPKRGESMQMLFFTCNGYSERSNRGFGPWLWQDVLKIHKDHHFHLMIGGGDQIYSDGVPGQGPKVWVTNSQKRRAVKVGTREMEDWYFSVYQTLLTPIGDAKKDCYVRCVSRIPSVNMWDDHDIVDGYGSYTNSVMRSLIFAEIGAAARKYYMLFQHHTDPNEFEDDVKPDNNDGVEAKAEEPPAPREGGPNEADNKGDEKNRRPRDPCWVMGTENGPFMKKKSRSVFASLGPRTAFFALDSRTDRTIKKICYKSTYDAMFQRLEQEVNAKEHKIEHLLLLLTVPIAYPRFTKLEWLLTISSHMIWPLKMAHKLTGILSLFPGKHFNQFDGRAELLDDLYDHWCARVHKRERKEFVQRVQKFAKERQVRVTFLSGDVHVASVGRFFNRKETPQINDPNYMANVISSPITNIPPTIGVERALNRQHNMHFLDRPHKTTAENMMQVFDHNPRGADFTRVLAERNFCIISENWVSSDFQPSGVPKPKRRWTGTLRSKEQDFRPHIHDHGAPALLVRGNPDVKHVDPPGIEKHPHALYFSIRAEVDRTNTDGATRPYSFAIPPYIPPSADGNEKLRS